MKKETILPITIIVLPFVYYAWFMVTNLIPVEYPDSSAYLWRQPFSIYYLTGRSLTQRIIFTLSSNNGEIISMVQLGFSLFTALALYLLLSRGKRFIFKVIIACFVTFLFSSFTLSISAVVINSEPVFVNLLILVTFWLFLYKGPYQYTTIALIAIAFLFSKNVAPYYLISLLFMWFVTTPRNRWVKRNTLIVVLLVLLSFGRIQVTNVYDTSIHVNVLNSLYLRIFPTPERVAFFHEEYNMPVGSFVEQCRKQWVGIPCLGYDVLTFDPETRNYDLIEDEKGLILWIKDVGHNSYLRFLLIDNPLGTWHRYHEIFNNLSLKNTIVYMTEYLGTVIPTNEPNNLVQLQELGKEDGFGGGDSLSILHTLLLYIGFGHASIVAAYALVGWLALIKFRAQASEYLPLAISLLSCSLGLFFLTYFGDGMEIKRHVFPCFILLTMGGILYILSCLEFIVSIAKKPLNLKPTGESV